MTVGELVDLLSKYNNNEKVTLYTGVSTIRGEIWAETEKYSIHQENGKTVYIEGKEAN